MQHSVSVPEGNAKEARTNQASKQSTAPKPKCPTCDMPYESVDDWCKTCDPKRLTANFDSWTSGRQDIDECIRKTQENPEDYDRYWEWIEPDKFADIKHLADGGFGSVYTARWLEGPREFLRLDNVDILPKGRGDSIIVILKTVRTEHIGKGLLEELRSLAEMYDEGDLKVPKVYGVTKYLPSDSYAIVMKYYMEGDLRKALAPKKKPMLWYRRLEMLYHISYNLAKFHEKGLVHCDLHSGNIFITDAKAPLISDLGLSRPSNSEVEGKGTYGVVPYMAPELFRGQPHSQETDVYALGVIMWEISSGEPPFSDRNQDDVNLIISICQGTRPPIVPGTPAIWEQLMKKCWDTDPKNRPTAKDVYEEVFQWCMDDAAEDELRQADEYAKLNAKPMAQEPRPNTSYCSRFVRTLTASSFEEFEDDLCI